MPVDPELLAGLRAAVEAVPDNLALRLHVATLLLDAGRPAESLEHSSAVLALVPGQREAVELVDRATAALPDTPFPVPAAFPAAPAEPQHRGATLDQWVLGEVEEPRTTLADVGGMPAIKRWLSTAFLSPLRDPNMRRLFGRSLRGGLLMYGPPGCGKTFLARALAGDEGEHGRAVLQRLGRPARLQQQGGHVQAQGQVVGHGLDRGPEAGEQLWVDRHGATVWRNRLPRRTSAPPPGPAAKR